MHRQESLVEKRWNAEYGRGRYSGEAPVEMITRILAAARARNLPAGCLQRGTVQDLAPGISFPLVIGIQVFQHGTAAAAAAHVRAAGARVSPGGIFAIRVNAAGTDVHPAHRVIEEKDGAFTVEYLDGPKRGLDIHFFSGPEHLEGAQLASHVIAVGHGGRCLESTSRTGGSCHPAVEGRDITSESFRQCDMPGVTGRHVVPQLPYAGREGRRAVYR
jgi:hypothetical protein